MSTRWKCILYAMVLGLFCPALIIGILQRNYHNEALDVPSMDTSPTADTSSLYISVMLQDGTIQRMKLDDYLTCVVLQEMPASFETEALKAQATVARTYALRRSEVGGKHSGAAVCTNSDCCQGYCDLQSYLARGGKSENIDKIRNAVCSTTNLVLVYNDKLIDATYFSCSGGMTEDAAAVWGAEIPYLQSTESPGEEHASHYVDTVTFLTEDFLNSLGLEIVGKAQIGKITYTDGGGVDTIDICEQQFKGTEIRKLLGLRSTAFAISVVGDTVTITTKGFGHRVGMSQYGADAMAASGAGFTDILAHYYHGIQLVEYKGN